MKGTMLLSVSLTMWLKIIIITIIIITIIIITFIIIG